MGHESGYFEAWEYDLMETGPAAKDDEVTPERVYDLAEAHNGQYLLAQHEYRDKDDVFKACEALVIDGYARWDRNSRYWPCIKLTGKPYPA